MERAAIATPGGAKVQRWAATIHAGPATGTTTSSCDEALEESFPASDPPAGNGSVMPPAPSRPDPDDKEG